MKQVEVTIIIWRVWRPELNEGLVMEYAHLAVSKVYWEKENQIQKSGLVLDGEEGLEVELAQLEDVVGEKSLLRSPTCSSQTHLMQEMEQPKEDQWWTAQQNI